MLLSSSFPIRSSVPLFCRPVQLLSILFLAALALPTAIAAGNTASDFILKIDGAASSVHSPELLDVHDFRIQNHTFQNANENFSKQTVAMIRLNKDGYVLSSNPVWNACTRGKATLGLIKSNRDKVTYRQGRIMTLRPKSCDQYHRNMYSVWRHPDFEGLDLTLDNKGRLLGGVPIGYIAARDISSSVASK